MSTASLEEKGSGTGRVARFLSAFRRQCRSLWRFAGRPLREILVETGRNALADDLTGRAAQLSYYFFLSLFPALIFVTSVIGLIAGSQNHLRDHLMRSFAAFLPPSAYNLVVSTFTEVVHTSSARTAALGIIFALWTATSGASAMQDTLNGVYRVKETRPFWKSTLMAVALTIVTGTLLMLALVAFFYGGDLVAFRAPQLGLNAAATLLWKLVQWPIAIFLLSIAFAVIYYWAPDLKKKQWRWITPGSVIAVVGWFAVSGALRAYLHFFNSYSVTYGSLGAVIILLLWFYLTGLMLLLGAEFNATIELLAAKEICVPPVAEIISHVEQGLAS